MISQTSIAPFSEAYEVAKTVEVVATIGGAPRRVRIDALEDLLNAGQFSTKAYIEEDLQIQPTFPVSGQTGPQSYRVWVALDHPWTSRQSADAALEQALAFLSDGTR